MGEMLRADIEALRVMAAGVRVQAEAINGMDPVDLIAKVGRAMPNSATGSAAVDVSAPLLTALRRMAAELTTLADTTDRGATTYEETDRALSDQLDHYLHGTS
ncbi:hypothetical protein JK358_31590 [Nocardia sp. 2]|uniref:Excreted virulence factor EspC (Type VII ESX diderm) n=1 Tax=Nocardia acididurans TaxID=2802282 RepID=A0ABS1ME96_9NOCA|nr:hypothetical protein [Nocardia acididurans]MBL1078957.1 hypothetical protein [Nocardia acididurans]